MTFRGYNLSAARLSDKFYNSRFFIARDGWSGAAELGLMQPMAWPCQQKRQVAQDAEAEYDCIYAPVWSLMAYFMFLHVYGYIQMAYLF